MAEWDPSSWNRTKHNTVPNQRMMVQGLPPPNFGETEAQYEARVAQFRMESMAPQPGTMGAGQIEFRRARHDAAASGGPIMGQVVDARTQRQIDQGSASTEIHPVYDQLIEAIEKTKPYGPGDAKWDGSVQAKNGEKLVWTGQLQIDSLGNPANSCFDPTKKNLLFRALRREEVQHLVQYNALIANCNPCPSSNPCCDISFQEHVARGSSAGFASRFISLTTNVGIAALWASAPAKDGVVVGPSATQLSGSGVFAVVDPTISSSPLEVINPADYMAPGQFRNAALASAEVLIADRIPWENVVGLCQAEQIQTEVEFKQNIEMGYGGVIGICQGSGSRNAQIAVNWGPLTKTGERHENALKLGALKGLKSRFDFENMGTLPGTGTPATVGAAQGGLVYNPTALTRQEQQQQQLQHQQQYPGAHLNPYGRGGKSNKGKKKTKRKKNQKNQKKSKKSKKIKKIKKIKKK